MSKRSTRTSLLMSVVAMLLSVTMLMGSTFAWFTDSVTATNNVIVAGNLDVELYYQNDEQTTWTKVGETTNIFKQGTLWEPGHVEVIKLMVANKGTLALKYNLGINIAKELGSVNKDGVPFKLSDYIYFGVVEGNQNYTREQAVAAVNGSATLLNKAFTVEKTLMPAGQSEDNKIVTVVVYMPETVGNEANYAKGQTAPKIDLGLNLFATQLTHEKDSFGNDYDELAPELTIEVTPANIQEYLDGQHGDLKYVTLQLTPGNYGVLNIGVPTKYEGSNTEYTCTTHDFTTDDAEAFKAHLAEPVHHGSPKYTRTVSDLTIKGTDGAVVAGVLATSSHVIGPAYDYVRDVDYTAGSAYYNTIEMTNVTFKDVAFEGRVNLDASDETAVYDGIEFHGCSFTTGGTNPSNAAAIRYYNEANNGNVRNITVKNCTFNNCYQGVYVHNVNGVTVTNNKFDTTGHNAIALQNHNGPIDLKDVVIKNNVFKNIGDRVVRFGDVGADSNITMEYNLATSSGDDNGECVKATVIEAGATVTANYNDWGGTVVNPELADVETAKLAADASGFKNAATAVPANPGETKEIVLLDDIAAEDLQFVNFANDTVINGNGNSIVRETGNGNPLTVNSTNKVTFEDFKFESNKTNAVLATRKDGANIEINDCIFQSYAAPSTGSTGIQVYAKDVTMVFNNCEFYNMPIVTSSSYPGAVKLEFNNCKFSWTGANCSGMIQLANNVVADIDFNGCSFTYDSPTSTRTYKFVGTGTSVGAGTTITFNDSFTMTGTAAEGKIWRIVEKGGVKTGTNVTVEVASGCTAEYTFNGTAVDINTYLFG